MHWTGIWSSTLLSFFSCRLSSSHESRSLSRDSKYTVEKEQAIKLIRAIVEIGSLRRGPAVGCGKVPLSEPVMRAFIAIAEQPEDAFKPICVQTLVEICKSLSPQTYLLLTSSCNQC